MRLSIAFVLCLLITQFGVAQQAFEIKNEKLVRKFIVKDSVVFTNKLTNLKTSKEFIRNQSNEFSFYLNNKQLTSASFVYLRHKKNELKGIQHLEIELQGKVNSISEGIGVKLNFWVYENISVVRKQICIMNYSDKEITLTNLDIESLNIDVSGVHISEIHTGYGQNLETAPYKGNYYDAALLMYDERSKQGLMIGNEAMSVLKNTEIYTGGFPLIQIGLSKSSDNFPFKKVLKKGEVFLSPKVFLCPVEAKTWQLAYEGDFAEFIRKYADIRLNTHKQKPLLMYNTWRPFRTNITESIIKESVEALQGSGTDLFIIDCGWYDMMGNYNADKTKFPEGMVPVCKYIIENGMKAGMWFSFATANVSSDVVKEHPEWTLKDKFGKPVLVHDVSGATLGETSYTMSMDSPWYDYIYNVISKYIRDCNLSYVKLDLAAVIGSYQPDLTISGDYEGGGVKNYADRDASYWSIFQKTLEFCDDLHKEFPELLIDYTYETHGRHNGVDYALLQHAEYDWITNYELEAPEGPISIRQMRFNRARTMPVSTLLIGNQNMLNASKSMNEFTYLSVVSATGILVGDVRNMDKETRTWYKKWNDWFKTMDNTYEFTKYYQIGDVFDYPTDENWDGCYRFNTEKQGGVLFFYRNNSSDSQRIFKLHCVDEHTQYKVSEPFTLKNLIYSGKQLKNEGLPVQLKNKYSAVVYSIEKVDSLSKID